MPQPNLLETGAVLQNRYQLQRPLCHNPVRQTWLAVDLDAPNCDRVIVKLLAFGGAVQWDDLKLFEREAQVLKQLNHPRIPQYRDYFAIDERSLWFGLVQDYIPGNSFKDLLARGEKFNEAQIRQIGKGVLEILSYLHALSPPVLHRDIKPSNLILGEDEQVYLVDFGAVQDRATTEGVTFTVVGTFGYAPLEQFSGRAIPSSDLYALGATLIHLVTGILPADLPQQDLRWQFRDKVSVNAHLIRWLEALTEPAPERRLQTAIRAIEALEDEAVLVAELEQQQPNLSAIALAATPVQKLEKPFGTRIKLSKSRKKLQIKIPKRGVKLADSPAIIFSLSWATIVVWLTVNAATNNPIVTLFLLPFLTTALVSIAKNLNLAFGQIRLSLKKGDRFTLEREIFDYTYYRQTVSLTQIKQVYLERKRTAQPKRNCKISFDVGVETYSFGESLTNYECEWLEQEIKSWLDRD